MSRKQLSIEHLNAYLPGGAFHKLFEVVKSDPDLAFEIRQGDKTAVYYNKAELLSIEWKRNSCYKIHSMNPGYFSDGKGPSIDVTDNDFINRKSCIVKYLKQAKLCAYKYKMNHEFAVQQRICLGNSSFDGRYLAIDMEWNPDSPDVKPEDRIKSRVDLVVVDLEKNSEGKNDIYLTEVKYGTGAAYGASGIQDHVEKTARIRSSIIACALLESDIRDLIDQKAKLGIITGNLDNASNLQLAAKPKMMLFLSYSSEDELTELKNEVEHMNVPKSMPYPLVIYHSEKILIDL